MEKLVQIPPYSPHPPFFFSFSSSVAILMERKWKWMQPGEPNTVTVTATFKLIQLIIIHNPVWSFQQGQVTFNFGGQITTVKDKSYFSSQKSQSQTTTALAVDWN